MVALLIVGVVYVFGSKKGSSFPETGISDTIVFGEDVESIAEIPVSTGITDMNKATELEIKDLIPGTGEVAVSGKNVSVNYIGTLVDGTKFDSSYDRNEPFSFTLGIGQVIEGWEEGIVGMKVGGKRKLTIPSSMAYGEAGIPGVIPGGATLVFEVELLEIK